MPLNAATGSTGDISPMLRLYFWKPVYFNEDDMSLPSDTTEVRGRFVGISENVVHDMTVKILNSYTKKIINRSVARPADDAKLPNLRAEPLTYPEVIKLLHDDYVPNLSENASNYNVSPSSSKWSMPELDPRDLVGRSFLTSKEYGKCLKTRITKAFDDS